MRTPEEIEMIKEYVEKHSYTWYAGNQRQYRSRIKLFMEISEPGMTAQGARANLVTRIAKTDFLFNYIKGPNNVQSSTKA